MKLEIDKELLEEIANEKKRDLDRYYQSLLYILGLKYYFQKNKHLKANFIGLKKLLKKLIKKVLI